MAEFMRYRVDLAGFEGAPGVSVLHTTRSPGDSQSEIQAFATLIHNAYQGVIQYLLGGLTVKVNPDVTLHDVTSGQLLDAFVVTPPATVTGTGTALATSRATMAVARHKTDLVTAQGKRLQGRTFVGPLDGAAVGPDGHLTAGCQTAISGMWDGMQDVVGPVRLLVWHRAVFAPGHEPGSPPIRNGEMGHVQVSTCMSLPGVLRSRRD